MHNQWDTYMYAENTNTITSTFTYVTSAQGTWRYSFTIIEFLKKCHLIALHCVLTVVNHPTWAKVVISWGVVEYCPWQVSMSSSSTNISRRSPVDYLSHMRTIQTHTKSDCANHYSQVSIRCTLNDFKIVSFTCVSVHLVYMSTTLYYARSGRYCEMLTKAVLKHTCTIHCWTLIILLAKKITLGMSLSR